MRISYFGHLETTLYPTIAPNHCTISATLSSSASRDVSFPGTWDFALIFNTYRAQGTHIYNLPKGFGVWSLDAPKCTQFEISFFPSWSSVLLMLKHANTNIRNTTIPYAITYLATDQHLHKWPNHRTPTLFQSFYSTNEDTDIETGGSPPSEGQLLTVVRCNPALLVPGIGVVFWWQRQSLRRWQSYFPFS